jgi:UDP-N-acetyl-D-galactosamine dehydrogenase
MGKFIVEQTIKQLVKLGHPVSGARVTVLGLTFKEDCADLRNSRVQDILNELHEYCCEVSVHEPMANPADALHEYGVTLTDWEDLPAAHAIILAVPHRAYLDRGTQGILTRLLPDGVIIDVKSVLDRDTVAAAGAVIWRL